MRCLHCGKRLPILRQIANSGFCSKEHRRKYMEEQESLGLARLIDCTRNSNSVSAGGTRTAQTTARHSHVPAPANRFFAQAPNSQSVVNPYRAPGDSIKRPLIVIRPQVEAGLSRCVLPRARPQTSVSQARRGMETAQLRPAKELGFSPPVELPCSTAEAVAATRLFEPPAAAWMERACESVALKPRISKAYDHLAAGPAPALPRLSAKVQTGTETTQSAGVLSEPAQVAAEKPAESAKSTEMSESAPADFLLGMQPPRPSASDHYRLSPEHPGGAAANVRLPSLIRVSHATPRQAGLVRLQLAGAALPESATASEPVELPYPAVTRMPSLPGAGARLLLRQPDFIAVPIPCTDVAAELIAEPAPEKSRGWLFLPPPDATIRQAGLMMSPEPAPFRVAAFAGTGVDRSLGEPVAAVRQPEPHAERGAGPASARIRLPETTGLVAPLELPSASEEAPAPPTSAGAGETAAPSQQLDQLDRIVSGRRPDFVAAGLDSIIPRDAATEHVSFLQPRSMCPKPMAPASGLGTVAEQEPQLMEPAPSDPLWKRAWGPVVERYSSVPAGMKWAGLAIPLVVAVLLRMPDVAPPRAALEGSGEGVPTVFASQWHSFQDDIARRAAISLSDDFRSGLGDWDGAGNWAESWSYDPAGFVRPGRLAIYMPSVPLSDYRMEFVGQIERRALSWVCRAADASNYYAMKLVIVEPGPLPRAAIIRYPVIDGRAGRRIHKPLPFTLRNQRMHRVRIDVRGDNYTAYVDGQLVDFWTYHGRDTGGVGFFRDGGERSRLRWVSVTHQYDFLGRLCALLAPYSIDDRQRNWNQ